MSFRLFDISQQSQSPLADSYFGETIESLAVSFDNTGLIMAIGSTYQKEDAKVTKIDFHSISDQGSKGKFQNIFILD